MWTVDASKRSAQRCPTTATTCHCPVHLTHGIQARSESPSISYSGQHKTISRESDHIMCYVIKVEAFSLVNKRFCIQRVGRMTCSSPNFLSLFLTALNEKRYASYKVWKVYAREVERRGSASWLKICAELNRLTVLSRLQSVDRCILCNHSADVVCT